MYFITVCTYIFTFHSNSQLLSSTCPDMTYIDWWGYVNPKPSTFSSNYLIMNISNDGQNHLRLSKFDIPSTSNWWELVFDNDNSHTYAIRIRNSNGGNIRASATGPDLIYGEYKIFWVHWDINADISLGEGTQILTNTIVSYDYSAVYGTNEIINVWTGMFENPATTIFWDDCTLNPTTQPTLNPTAATNDPTNQPTNQPSTQPSSAPSNQPSNQPSAQPSKQPSAHPSKQPSSQPTLQPSQNPTQTPTYDDGKNVNEESTTMTRNEFGFDDKNKNDKSNMDVIKVVIIIVCVISAIILLLCFVFIYWKKRTKNVSNNNMNIVTELTTPSENHENGITENNMNIVTELTTHLENNEGENVNDTAGLVINDDDDLDLDVMEDNEVGSDDDNDVIDYIETAGSPQEHQENMEVDDMIILDDIQMETIGQGNEQTIF